MTNLRARWMGLVLLAALIASACSPTQDSLLSHEAPSTTPSIVGQITAVTRPQIVVEENPAESYGSAKAHVQVTDKTRVSRQDKGAVAGDELAVGQTVKIWFAGPVMESYPVQATAGVIVIEAKPSQKGK